MANGDRGRLDANYYCGPFMATKGCRAVFLSAAVLLSACNLDTNTPQKLTALQGQVDGLKGVVDGQAQALDGLKQQLEAQKQAQDQTAADLLKIQLGGHRWALFEPVTSQGYQLLDVGVARVMVSIENVVPYADGVRVQLMIGNPNAMTLSGLDGEIEYGSSSASIKNKDDYAAWAASLKKVPASIPEVIQPGRWNPVTVTLPGIKATDLGRISITLTGNKVLLGKG